MDWDSVEILQKRPRGTGRARIIWWYLERPDAHRRKLSPEEMFRESISETLENGWVDEVWTSERTLSRWDDRLKFVLLGSHPGLREPAPASEERWHVAHLGQLTPRRSQILADVRARGRTVSPNAWGTERSAILASSSLLLNIERIDGLHLWAPLRFALAAAYELPIVSERAFADPDPLVSGQSILEADYERLSDLVEEALRRPEIDLQDVGRAAHETLCREYPFARGVREALA